MQKADISFTLLLLCNVECNATVIDTYAHTDGEVGLPNQLANCKMMNPATWLRISDLENTKLRLFLIIFLESCTEAENGHLTPRSTKGNRCLKKKEITIPCEYMH